MTEPERIAVRNEEVKEKEKEVFIKFSKILKFFFFSILNWSQMDQGFGLCLSVSGFKSSSDFEIVGWEDVFW